MTTARQLPSFRQITDAQIRDPDQFATRLNGHLKDVGNSLAQIAPWVLRDVTVTIPEKWTDATLAHSWVLYDATYNTPGYRQDATGRVYLRGAAKSGTYGALSILTLPESMWPPLVVSFAVVQSNATYEPSGRLNISTAGVVTAPDITSVQTGVSTFLSLEGVSFDGSGIGQSLAQTINVDTRGLAGAPARVSVKKCYQVTTTVPFAYPQIAWQSVGQTVQITQVAGLPPGTYSLRLLIEA